MVSVCRQPITLLLFYVRAKQIRVVVNRFHSTFLYFFLGDKSRSVVPYQGQLNNLLADESVMRANSQQGS